MSMINDFPGLKKAFLEIAYDNGGINRERSEETMLEEASQFLYNNAFKFEYEPMSKWLDELSKEDLSTLCAGEHSEGQEILMRLPPLLRKRTDTLLNQYFDEVC